MAIGAAACERIAICSDAVRDGQDIIVDRVGVGLSIAGEQDRELIGGVLSALPVPAGDAFDLERDADGPHASMMKTDLNREAGEE